MTRWVHGISRDLLRHAFSEYFGVSQGHAAILVALYGCPGEHIPIKRLGLLVDNHRPPLHPALYERIRVLREIMEPESLISAGPFDAAGYCLTEVGIEECRKALAAIAEAMLRAAPQVEEPSRTARR